VQAVETTDASRPARGEHGTLGSLGERFWRFFLVALFFDIGFGLYFFLINLYLAQAHFQERTIGVVASALTIGNIAATVPTGILARRIGLRPMLAFCLIASPLFAAARIVALPSSLQIALAFAQGAAMCSYTVCFAPAIAALTTPRNRTTAFSLTFGAGIGSGVVCGLFGGAAPDWLRHAHPSLTQTSAMGLVLLVACVIPLVSILPLIRLSFPSLESSPAPAMHAVSTSFARRFLTMVALWSLGTGAFAPFATIYFSGSLRIPLPRIGMIFSASQLLQVGGVLTAPVLYRRIGKEYGIAALQIGASIGLILLFAARSAPWAIAAYLCMCMFHYMCNPGIYGLLMDRTREDLRPAASAWQNFVTSTALACASAIGGTVIAAHGYAPLFAGCACLCMSSVALTYRISMKN
jgi:MFS family permease